MKFVYSKIFSKTSTHTVGFKILTLSMTSIANRAQREILTQHFAHFVKESDNKNRYLFCKAT